MILDVMLPGRDGFRVLEELRRERSGTELREVLESGIRFTLAFGHLSEGT